MLLYFDSNFTEVFTVFLIDREKITRLWKGNDFDWFSPPGGLNIVRQTAFKHLNQ